MGQLPFTLPLLLLLPAPQPQVVVQKNASGGNVTLVLFHIGDANDGPVSNCSSSVDAAGGGVSSSFGGRGGPGSTVHYATNPYGPWTPVNTPPPGCNNPVRRSLSARGPSLSLVPHAALLGRRLSCTRTGRGFSSARARSTRRLRSSGRGLWRRTSAPAGRGCVPPALLSRVLKGSICTQSLPRQPPNDPLGLW